MIFSPVDVCLKVSASSGLFVLGGGGGGGELLLETAFWSRMWTEDNVVCCEEASTKTVVALIQDTVKIAIIMNDAVESGKGRRS